MMKYIAILMVALVAFTLLMAGCIDEEEHITDDVKTKDIQITNPIAVRFRVIDSINYEPIEGVLVQHPLQGIGDFYTDEEGYGEYSQQGGTRYMLELSKEGYENEYFEVYTKTFPKSQDFGDVQMDAVRDNYPPVADAGRDREEPTGVYIEFDASGSTDRDGFITLYEWDFDGDGNYETETVNPKITYRLPPQPIFNISLRVTDDSRDSDVDYVVITASNVEEDEPQETPGFEGIFAVIALLGILGVIKWKKYTL